MSVYGSNLDKDDRLGRYLEADTMASDAFANAWTALSYDFATLNDCAARE